MSAAAKSDKMGKYLNCRVRVDTLDGKHMVGQLLAFDRHMNMVLSDCEEYRRVKPKGSNATDSTTNTEHLEKRTLGLIILRGDNFVSANVEAPPPKEGSEARIPAMQQLGPGVARPATRAMPVMGLPSDQMINAPMGIAGPVRDIGGPAPDSMGRPPMMAAAPIAYPPMPFPPGMPPMMRPPGMPPMGHPGMPPMMPPPGMPFPPGARPPPGMPPMMVRRPPPH